MFIIVMGVPGSGKTAISGMLVQNFVRNGYPPIGYDVAPRLPEDFDVKVTKSLEELAGALTPPRTFFLMVPAGAPVDSAIASLVYFDAYRSEVLPANLTQGQRDYFGAHTYRRVDKEGVFHTHWEG